MATNSDMPSSMKGLNASDQTTTLTASAEPLTTATSTIPAPLTAATSTTKAPLMTATSSTATPSTSAPSYDYISTTSQNPEKESRVFEAETKDVKHSFNETSGDTNSLNYCKNWKGTSYQNHLGSIPDPMQRAV